MGHYDDSYAYDEVKTILNQAKDFYYQEFDTTYKDNTKIFGTLDDVRGQLLIAWAEENQKRTKITNRHILVE